MKNPAFYTASLAIGDCICATPTIRKISQTYNTKVVVFSHHPDIFNGLPYVERSEDVKEFITLEKSEALRQEYDLHYSFWKMGQKVPLSDDRGIEMKHSMIDIRQYHSIDNGFTLLPEELSCDFIPSNGEIPDLPEKYICLHPFKNWPSRTWDDKNWTLLLDYLKKLEIPVVLIGKDSLDKNIIKYLKDGVRGETDSRVFDEIDNRKSINLSTSGVTDLTNKTSLSQAWHVIDKAEAVVTMDSGILHLAGTTDSHIIQLGSSIHPHFRSPYRKGSQEYKYSFVGGSCNLFCASDMKYSLRDWEYGCNGGTPLQCVTLIDNCLENKEKFECHPQVNNVVKEIKLIWENKNIEVIEDKSIGVESNLPLLIKIQSTSLGDQIGALVVIDSIASKSPVTVICGLNEGVFNQSYPHIQFLSHEKDPVLSKDGSWHIGEMKFVDFKRLYYKFNKPLMDGYAEQLGVTQWERPRIDKFLGERPIKSKYVCFSMHSTAQAKHWNYPDGWDLLCKRLRKVGITPVCIDRHSSFGNDENWNEVPRSAVRKQGMDLKEMSNYIHHCEFFIGISSGLSWVAHALGKKVVMISGVTSGDNEFTEDTYRIIENSVCNGCINKKEIKFDPSDWMWCPLHKGTSRQFECTKSISPNDVFGVIKEKLL